MAIDDIPSKSSSERLSPLGKRRAEEATSRIDNITRRMESFLECQTPDPIVVKLNEEKSPVDIVVRSYEALERGKNDGANERFITLLEGNYKKKR